MCSWDMSKSIEGNGVPAAKSKRKNAVIHRLESLEPRKLLTTLVGGDMFMYQDVDGQLVVISVTGDAIVELIGAQTNPGEPIVLGHLTGQFLQSEVNKTGISVGPNGVKLLGTTPIIDPFVQEGSIPWVPNGAAEINIQALASRPDTGATYGFNVITANIGGTPTEIVQLIEFDTLTGNGTVIAHLQAGLPANIDGIRAAAFDPTDPDMLYFVAEAEGIDRLYSLDITDPLNTLAQAPGSFGELNDDVRDVVALAFDEVGGATSLLALLVEDGVNRIVDVDQTNTGNFGLNVEVTFGGQPLSNLQGMVLAGDDPAAFDNFVFAVESAGGGSQLYAINIATGEAIIINSLPDETDTQGPIRGQNIQDITWNPTVISPFTGAAGAFIGVDATTDELVFIDPFSVETNQLFAIYVTQTSENASISVATYHVPQGQPPVITPFTGVSELQDDGTNTIVQTSDTVYDLVVMDTQGNPIIITFEDGIGGAYIGAKDWVLVDDELRPLLPVLEGTLDVRVGTYAPGVDTSPDGLGNVGAGIFVAPTLLDYFIGGATVVDRMMGENLDIIAGLAVKRDMTAPDAIVVIDIDNYDANGDEIIGGGDQLAILDPNTGKAIELVDVVDGADGITPMTNVQAMGFGDLTFSGTETLYAVYSVGGVLTLGTIDTDPDSATFGHFTEIGALDATLQASGVRTMAFSPAVGSVAGQQALYIIGNDNAIYEVDATDGSVVAGGDLLVQTIDGVPIEVQIGSIVFNRFGTQLLGHDTDSGRLVDIDLTMIGGGTVEVGQVVATEAGTLRPTLGGIAYDYTNDRYLAVDNSVSMLHLTDQESALDTPESAVLMKLRGIDTGTDTSQHIDSILIGGKVTGLVDIAGSIHTFYAGSLLTGQSVGQSLGGPERPGNFNVDGDIRTLITASSIGTHAGTNGTEPVYMSGFDMVVGGTVGEIWTINSFLGTVEVVNDLFAPGFDMVFHEMEGRATSGDPLADVQSAWLAGLLYDGTERFYNDTWATATILGTLRGDGDGAAFTTISGVLFDTPEAQDYLDYYAISLMAGQTVEVVLDEALSSALRVGIFDPEGRLIASNQTTTGFDVTFEPFAFTADRPGQYRIVVAVATNNSFEEGVGTDTFPQAYTIHINNVGDMGIGGIRAYADILSVASGRRSFHVHNGDLGGFIAFGSLMFATGATPGMTPSDIDVRNGNLRAIHVGGDIAQDSAPVIEVRNGGIGVIRNDGAELYFITGAEDEALVDGHIQLIDAAGNLGGMIYTNSSIGVVRANEMTIAGGSGSTYLAVNVDGVGDDGVIDLIDVIGDFGTQAGGGPGIQTGIGGNVRYMRVGGTIYQDAFFQTGVYDPLTLAEGQSHVHVDDGGGRVRITPGQIANPLFDDTLPEGPDNPRFLQGALVIRRYGVRGAGGSVLVDVASSGFGIEFESLSNLGSNGPVEVGSVQVAGEGQTMVLDANGVPVIDPLSGPELKVIFRGSLPIDVLEIVGGNITEIANLTGSGEIVNVIADSVGELRANGSIGLPRSSTGAILDTNTLVADGYPFQFQTTGVAIFGHVGRIRAGEGLGNIMVLGSAGEIRANNNNVNTSGHVEGILAPVYVAGDLFLVNIGEGLAPTGSGAMAHGGLYVEGRIHRVENQGLGSDIRGDIISLTGIDTIHLTHGSIIGSLIAVLETFESSSAVGGAQDYPDQPDTLEIGNITLQGLGGIIGSRFAARDMGNITVKNGFGIVNSAIHTVGQASIGNITVDGFGLLGTTIQAANSMGNVTITGKGQALSIQDFAESVRYSDYDMAYDPFYNVRLNRLTDLSQAFATDPENNPHGLFLPRYELIAGQLHSTSMWGLVNLGTVRAHRISNSTIDFANSIAGIITGRSVDNDPTTINNLAVTTGLLKQFKPGADVSGLDLTVAGLIKAIQLRGNLIGDSSIRATGNNGAIGSVVVTGELQGSLFATNGIGKINVGGNMIGDVTANGTNVAKGNTVNSMVVGGNFLGSINVGGDVGTITVNGSLGQIGDVLYIDGSLKKLTVGNKKVTNVADVIAIGRTNINDILIPEGTFEWSNQGVSQINLQAIASRSDRRTYSFNVVTVDIDGVATQLVQLVELNTFTGEATVRFHLQDDAALPGSIDAIRAAAFDPTNLTHLYFVAESNGIDQLFWVDVTTGVVTAVAGTFGEVTDVRKIQAIAFDEDATHVNGRALYALVAEGNTTRLVEVDVNDSDTFLSNKEVTFKNKSVANLTGLTLLVDDPNAMDGAFLAVEANGNKSRILAINLTDGSATELGRPLVADSLRGQNLQGLTYNPLLEDPFTGQMGAFIAVDATTDELVYVNGRGARVSNIVVNGDVNCITVFGQLDGSVTVGGSVKQLLVTAEDNNIGGQLINDDIRIGGDLNTLVVRDGHVGQFATIASMTGNINKVQIINGSLFGNLQADNGSINSVVVTGSDLGGVISALSANLIRFDGSIHGSGGINIVNELRTLQIGQDVIVGANIAVGALQNMIIGGTMMGGLDLGYSSRGTQIRIGGDWFVANGSTIDSDVTINVGGDLVKQALASVLNLKRSVNQLRVGGIGSIDLNVGGSTNLISFNALDLSVLTFAHDVKQFIVSNDVTNTLVQVGISAGDDGVFASAAGEEDANETSRIAHLQTFTVGSMTDSIVAAGGSINRFQSGTMTNSSVSAGLSLGSYAIRAVQSDITRLANAAEQNAARSGDDRVLYWGDITLADIRDGGMIGSYVTAGVDAGAAGDFTNPDVLSSVTGGMSVIGRINGTLGAGSHVVADSGINQNNTTAAGGTITDNVTYDIDDLTLNQGSALQAIAGTASQGTPLSLNGGAVTIVVNGPGTVTVYDDDPTDGVLDAVVLTDTTSNTRVTITGNGNYDIGRILTADDTTVGDFVFDGDLIGDGTDAPDLWIDGSMRRFSFNDLGGDFTGQIGGDIQQLQLADQGSGRVTIGGTVRSLTIGSANDTPLQNMLGAYANSYNTLSVDAAGNLWAHAGNGVLHRIDPTLNGPGGILETVNVFDAYSGNAPTLIGIDFLGGDLYAIARLYDPQPTQPVGVINDGVGVDLRGLAVNSAGHVYAIDSTSGVDQLVRIDPSTGQQTVIGSLRTTLGNFDFTQQVLALAFRKVGNDSEQLIALVSDQNGNGPGNAGVALVQIQTTPSGGFVNVHRIGNSGLPGALLDDGGAVNDAFTGLTTAADGTIYAVRRNGGNDELVTIDLDGTLNSLGNIEVNGGGAGVTTISGIGFDQDGNLLAYDNDGIAGRLIFLSAANVTLGDASAFEELSEGSAPINPDIDVFAVGRSGDTYRTYAYDTAGDGMFYASADANTDGEVTVLGTIDLATGAFQRLVTVGSADLTPGAGDLPFAADNNTNTIYLITSDGSGWNLVSFDPATMTFTQVGDLVDSSGRNVELAAIEFDDATGELIGLELESRRLVTIDTATGLVAVRTEPAVVSAGLTDLAYDPNAGTFYAFQNSATNRFVQLKGTTEADAGRIQAVSVDQLNIGSTYFGRLVTTGNTFNRVTLDGDFSGALVTAGGIKQLVQRSGDFNGLLEAIMDINVVRIAGDVLSQARFVAGSVLNNLNVRGDFAGTTDVFDANRVTINGSVLDSAFIGISNTLSQMVVSGSFLGEAVIGMISGNLRINGLLEDGAHLAVTGDVKSVQLMGGTEADATLNVGGSVTQLTVQNIHRGRAIVGRDLVKASFRDVDGGQLFVGRDGTQLAVNNSTDGLFAYGILLGEDETYNTADDRIRGGSLKTAKFGTFIDSVLTAGVLPPQSSGEGMPTDHRVYLRTVAGNGTVTNAAEAGGVRSSTIQNVSITNAITTSASKQSAIVAADAIGKINVRNGTSAVAAQVHNDPFGAPTVVEVIQLAPNRLRVIFSEALNTDSLSLSQVLGDGGTVVLTENGDIITGVTMAYTEQVFGDGSVRGVVTLTRNVDFGDEINLTLVGDGTTAIVDRSGFRSEWRNFGDPLGTALDGNGNGTEGGNFEMLVVGSDLGNDFTEDYNALGALTGTILINGVFNGADDVDIYSFQAVQGEYFAVSYSGPANVVMAVFYRDDQGTLALADDTFEMLARLEETTGSSAWSDANMFQAFELPATGEYFVAVAPIEGAIDGSYTLTLTGNEFTNEGLAEALGGTLLANNRIDLGNGNVQSIAYFTGPNRISKQLVYLNFEGGLSTQSSLGAVNFDPLDAAILDDMLAGQTDRLIHGGDGVIGIIDNIVTIFTSHPYASVIVEVLDLDDITDLTSYLSASSGLYFTTDDPSQSGNIPAQDYTTIFVGATDANNPGLYGIAGNIDVGNDDIADEALVLVENFADLSQVSTVTAMLNQYSIGLANVIAHELLHAMGFNHQPTDRENESWLLITDDPDNDGNAADSNAGEYGIMGYAPDPVMLSQLGQLGTNELAEFPVGHIDTAWLFEMWFS